jgi:hypothetical protein
MCSLAARHSNRMAVRQLNTQLDINPDDATATVMTTATAAICACGHPLDDHDQIGLRYCSATVAGLLSRGCICASQGN